VRGGAAKFHSEGCDEALVLFLCGTGVAFGIAIGGAAAGALLLGLGAVIDRLDLLTGQAAQRAIGAVSAPPPVESVTCPSCGERQDAPADEPHYDCVKCGEPVIRDWVYLGRPG